MDKKKELISVITGFLGAMLGLCGVTAVFKFVVMSLPIAARIVIMPVTYWLIALIPIIVMCVNKDKLPDYGFFKDKLGAQVITGILIGVIMSLVLTLLPHLFGFGEYVVNNKRYTQAWQFLYEFFYCIIAIGFVEEFVFRGFLYEKIRRISGKELTAIIVSSVLFGIFHIFSGSILQIFVTAFIGAFFCFCRVKIKNCSLLSLIIAHGIYDFLITVWACVFLVYK